MLIGPNRGRKHEIRYLWINEDIWMKVRKHLGITYYTKLFSISILGNSDTNDTSMKFLFHKMSFLKSQRLLFELFFKQVSSYNCFRKFLIWWNSTPLVQTMPTSVDGTSGCYNVYGCTLCHTERNKQWCKVRQTYGCSNICIDFICGYW